MKLVLKNIGEVLSGVLSAPRLDVSTVVVEDGVITSFDPADAGAPDTLVDCKEMTLAPGLVDTHMHPTNGDYATKQQSVGYLERMMHGGVTRCMSAGEVHVPGRAGADSALAIAHGAHASFTRFQPNGMKVHAGAMLLETDTQFSHIDQAYDAGMRIIGEVGIGSEKDSIRLGELSQYARSKGMTVHMHCGCTSDRGPGGDAHPYYGADDVLTVQPSIASHVNTFASLSNEDIDRLCEDDGPPFLEVVQAGGTRAMLRLAARLNETNQLDRLLIGTDTPTGYGVTSLGILKTVGDISSLAGIEPAVAWAIASGHGARAFGSETNTVEIGAPADLVLMDASLGSVEDTALEAIAVGDFPGISLVITDGEIRVNGSLCTLRSRRVATVETAGTP